MSAERIVARCECGREYKTTSDKIGKRLRCKACGNPFVVEPVEEGEPSPAKEPAPAKAAKAAKAAPVFAVENPDHPDEDWTPHLEKFKRARRMRIKGDVPEVDPDTLMEPIAKPVLGKTLAMSFVLHVLLLGITSISFLIHYTSEARRLETWDWMEIKKLLKEEREAAEKKRREEEAEQRRQERIQKQQEEDKKKDAERAKAESEGGGSDAEKELSNEIIEEVPGDSAVSFDLDADALEAE